MIVSKMLITFFCSPMTTVLLKTDTVTGVFLEFFQFFFKVFDVMTDRLFLDTDSCVIVDTFIVTLIAF